VAKSTSLTGAPRRVRFKRQPNGHATITIDGQDVSGLVMDYRVHAAHGEATTLTVTFASVAVDIDNPTEEA
jgi:hypothetical protein